MSQTLRRYLETTCRHCTHATEREITEPFGASQVQQLMSAPCANCGKGGLKIVLSYRDPRKPRALK